MDKFQDIMPIEYIDIPYSYYIFYIILFIVVGIGLYIYAKVLFKKTIAIKEKSSLEKLKELDLDSENTKQLLYDFTLLAKDIAIDKSELDMVLKKIEPYKYKKEEIKLDKKTKELLKGYIDAI